MVRHTSSGLRHREATPLPKGPSSGQVLIVRRALLDWFRRVARPLPWRSSSFPYEVWVSEVMLQQTQVATVIPYYHRFLEAFPTLASLARAPLERVFEIWSGMGYYRRARYLHRAVQTVLQEFDGAFPADYHLARSLPGVGDYTARAVLSIAYDMPFSVMDGNVARVMARLNTIEGSPGQPAFRRVAGRELDRLLSPRRPGAFNQAMMELGQTVCLPRAPRCPECPLRRWCKAFRRGRPEAYPEPKTRRSAEPHHLAAAVIQRRGRIALVRGLDNNLLPDLWNFPSAFGSSRAKAARNLRKKLETLTRAPAHLGALLGELPHSITFRSIRVHLYAAEVPVGRNSLRWFPMARVPEAAVSQLARKIARAMRR
jgi:A/G-specific adenine glycosylase